MLFADRRYIALDSMGSVLDNVDTDPQLQFMFMPDDGSVVYNPSTSCIETFLSDGFGCHVVSNRPVSQFELYLNRATKRAYTWNGLQMVEAELSIVPSEEPIVGETSFLTPNTTYHVASQITGPVTIGAGSTLVFCQGGSFVNCAISGENVKVVPNGEQTIFKNCNFTNCTFSDSSLFATNFGAVADMGVESEEDFQYKDLPAMVIQKRNGTNNLSQFQEIAAFLSGSCHIKLCFNGSFYIDSADVIQINDACDLELYGESTMAGQNPPCALIVGFKLIDCVDVFVHDLSFVGLHLPHDFPTIVASNNFVSNLRKFITNPGDADGAMAYNEYFSWVERLRTNISLEVVENKNLNLMPFENVEQFDENIESILSNYTFQLQGDGVAEELGLANNGVIAYSESGMASGMHVWVDHCHFEMRQTCICGMTYNARQFSSGEELKEMFDMQGTNCTFSHIYFQALASHCHGTFFENCTGDYICQPIDWSVCANHSRARNCHFTNCLIGPKQEYRLECTELNSHNSLEDCYFEISDPFWTLGIKQFILQASQGALGDTMIVRNCVFKVNKRHHYYGIFCRSWRMLFKDVSLQLGYAPDEGGDNSELAKLGNLFYKDGDSTPVEVPIIELDNFELKAFTEVSYLFRYNIQADIRDSEFLLTQPTISCFELLKEATVCNSVFNFASGLSYFAVYTPSVSIGHTTVNGGPITFCLHHLHSNALNGGTNTNYRFIVRDSVFVNVGTFVYLNGNTSISLSGNNITTNALVDNALDDDFDVRIHVFGNHIRLRGLALRSAGSRLFGTDFLVANNFFTSTTLQKVMSDAVRTEYADQLYNNFFMGRVVPLNEGCSADRPLHPWQGMVFYNIGMGEYDIWNGEFWEHWSYPDED